MVEIKWYARGGQGGFTASKLLGLAAIRHSGKFAQAFPSFGPERRGAPVKGFTRIDDKPIRDHSELSTCDYAIVLDNTLIGAMDVTAGLKGDGILFINTSKTPEELGIRGDFKVVCYDASADAMRLLKMPITNTAMMAVAAAYTGLVDDEAMVQAIREGMPGRVAEKNCAAVQEIYQLALARKREEEKVHG